VPEAVISPLVEVEFASLLSQKVRAVEMSRNDAGVVLAQFRAHISGGFFRVVEAGAAEFELSYGWLARFDTPLRTLDALHLACAFVHGQEMITSDKLLARAARQVGVKSRLVR
jgi:uncharacterized protein